MRRPLRDLAVRLAVVAAVAGPAAMPATAFALSGDPPGNRTLSAATYSACGRSASSSACISAALADINAAHAAEGVPAMVLPSAFASMSVPEQLLNLANLERVARGLVPILGLSAPLNADAQTAAQQNQDPIPTNFYGTMVTSNWAGGYDSSLEADFAWMYDDGLGSPNLDCTSSNQSGCWGHRHDILWPFAAPVAMGAGYAAGVYGPSMTELFVGGDTQTGAGQPDAPIVQPAPPGTGGSGGSGTGSGGSGTGSGTGPGSGSGSGSGSAGASSGGGTTSSGTAASTGSTQVTGSGASGTARPWIARVASSGNTLALRLGCTGLGAAACRLRITVTVALTTATRHRGSRRTRRQLIVAALTVVIPPGRTKVVHLWLDRAGRRILHAHGTLRAQLRITGTGTVTALRRTVTFTATR